MPFDLARRHSSRVHRDDLVVEAGEPRLSLAHDPRLKAPVAVPRGLQFDLPELPLQTLFARPVA